MRQALKKKAPKAEALGAKAAEWRPETTMSADDWASAAVRSLLLRCMRQAAAEWERNAAALRRRVG